MGGYRMEFPLEVDVGKTSTVLEESTGDKSNTLEYISPGEKSYKNTIEKYEISH